MLRISKNEGSATYFLGPHGYESTVLLTISGKWDRKETFKIEQKKYGDTISSAVLMVEEELTRVELRTERSITSAASTTDYHYTGFRTAKVILRELLASELAATVSKHELRKFVELIGLSLPGVQKLWDEADIWNDRSKQAARDGKIKGDRY